MSRGQAFAVAVVVAFVLAACTGNDSNDRARETTTSGAPDALTTTESSATIESPSEGRHAELVTLPWADPADRHRDPLDAVAAFTDFIGYQNLAIGGFVPGDEGSGEIEFSFEEAASTGNREIRPVTTVFVRQSGPDDAWWVVGARSENAVIDEPQPDVAVGSPLRVAGTTVVIGDAVMLRLFAEGDNAALFDGPVTGGGVFALGDFSTDEVAYQQPSGGSGTLVFVTSYGVTTVPVAFASR